MAAIGTAAAQDLISQAAEKGYTADDAQALAKKLDGRDLEYLSKSAARRVAGTIASWPTKATAEAQDAAQDDVDGDEPLATARQIDYMVDLYARFTTRDEADRARADFARLTKRQATVKIDELKTTAS